MVTDKIWQVFVGWLFVIYASRSMVYDAQDTEGLEQSIRNRNINIDPLPCFAFATEAAYLPLARSILSSLVYWWSVAM